MYTTLFLKMIVDPTTRKIFEEMFPDNFHFSTRYMIEIIFEKSKHSLSFQIK